MKRGFRKMAVSGILTALMLATLLPVSAETEPDRFLYRFNTEESIVAVEQTTGTSNKVVTGYFTAATDVKKNYGMAGKWSKIRATPTSSKCCNRITIPIEKDPGQEYVDFTKYTYLNQWIYLPSNIPNYDNNGPSTMNILLNSTAGQFQRKINLDWKGWKLVTIKISSISNTVGTTDLSKIAAIAYDTIGWSNPWPGITEMRLDSAWLSNKLPEIEPNTVAGVQMIYDFTDENSSANVEYPTGKVILAKENTITKGGDYTTKMNLSKYYTYSIFSITPDVQLGEYDYINQWIYSDNAVGDRFNLVFNNTNGGYYMKQITVGWTGWKLVSIPKSEFTASGNPAAVGWDDIANVTYDTTGWGIGQSNSTNTNVYLDKLWASKEPEAVAVSCDPCVSGTKRKIRLMFAKVENFTEQTLEGKKLAVCVYSPDGMTLEGVQTIDVPSIEPGGTTYIDPEQPIELKQISPEADQWKVLLLDDLDTLCPVTFPLIGTY